MSAITDKFPELKKAPGSEKKSVPLPGGIGGFGGYGGGLGAGTYSGGFGSLFGDLRFIRLPGSDKDYGLEAGDPLLNAAVSAAVGWVSRAYGEAKPVVKRKDPQTGQWSVEEHGLGTLLENPNPNMSGRLMRRAIAVDLCINGNAYLVIERDRAGRVAELSWIPARFVQLEYTVGSSIPVDAYVYTAGTTVIRYAAKDVVHLRVMADPSNPRMGWSPMPAVLREISADNSISTMYSAIARNQGVVGLMISPSGTGEEAFLDEAAREVLQSQFDHDTTGENAGKSVVASKPISVTQVSQTIDDMAVDVMRQQIQSRICASIGIDVLVTGMNTDSATYTNKPAAEKNAWNNKILPDLALLAADLKTQLLPLLEAHPEECRIEWDTSEVAALQEDSNDRTRRASTEFRDGSLSLNEYRAAIGLARVELPGADIPRGYPITTAPQPGDNAPKDDNNA